MVVAYPLGAAKVSVNGNSCGRSFGRGKDNFDETRIRGFAKALRPEARQVRLRRALENGVYAALDLGTTIADS